MNFDNLILNDLMTGLYRLNPSFDSENDYLKNHSVATAVEVSQKSNVKVMTYAKPKNVARQVLTYNSKTFL